MKLFPIIFVVLLSGCSLFTKTVPVTQKFPDVVPELMKKCEELKRVEGDKVLITELLKTVVENYTLYYQCSTKVEGWQEWYEQQKKIHNEIK
jgi:hypothetical protein